jgi:hypothetical protein
VEAVAGSERDEETLVVEAVAGSEREIRAGLSHVRIAERERASDTRSLQETRELLRNENFGLWRRRARC